tara:strand:+ start:35 stop:241 length:207 start_codon:yes stop_codon:yes gene_type:complete
MLKIITWINFAAFILGVAGLSGAFFYRSKIFDSVLNGVKKELPSLVKEAMPSIPSVPTSTGGVNPFTK